MEPGNVLRDTCVHCHKKKLIVVVYVNNVDIYVPLCKKCLRNFRDEIVAYEAS